MVHPRDTRSQHGGLTADYTAFLGLAAQPHTAAQPILILAGCRPGADSYLSEADHPHSPQQHDSTAGLNLVKDAQLAVHRSLLWSPTSLCTRSVPSPTWPA